MLKEPFAYSQAWYESRGALLVEVVGEDGMSGWGEAFGPPRLIAPVVDFYKPLLVGADALATDLLWQTLYNRLRDHGQKGLAIEALSAVDIALWDLKGRHLGLPIHRLLGGHYASGSKPTPPASTANATATHCSTSWRKQKSALLLGFQRSS
jgi:D-galactarolactone cycloisomerase